MSGSVLRMVFASLLRNRMRTGLTILGVGIGIAAVICTAALGEAGTARVQKQIDALGEDLLWVRNGSRSLGGVRTGFGGIQRLTPEDASALTANVPAVSACSPEVQGRTQIIAGGSNWNTRYQGVWPSYFDIRHRTPLTGVVFSPVDLAASARVVVLGERVASELFDDGNPVGQTVRMNGFPFQVTGVLASKGTGGGGLDRDDAVWVPLTTATRSFNRRARINDILCTVDPTRIEQAQTQVTTLLRTRHHLEPDEPQDFQIQQPVQFLQMRAQAARTLTAMLTAIGAVSLVVGGVGIMNIMLVSVTERRREIGVRMAIGARVRDIRWQFLAEAAALGLVGGVVGVALGWAGATILSTQFDWPTIVSADVVALAAASAIGSGLAFGYLPAHRASRLDPIEAIRMEE
jgi:putative ABC transport system permease protein